MSARLGAVVVCLSLVTASFGGATCLGATSHQTLASVVFDPVAVHVQAPAIASVKSRFTLSAVLDNASGVALGHGCVTIRMPKGLSLQGSASRKVGAVPAFGGAPVVWQITPRERGQYIIEVEGSAETPPSSPCSDTATVIVSVR